MIKKIFKSFFVIIIVIIVGLLLKNIYLNNPNRIKLLLKDKIQNSDCKDCLSASDWLWQDGRSFEFEIKYMNLFSPGSARMDILGDKFERRPVYILKAMLKTNTLFKKIYDVSMEISSVIEVETKLPRIYKERTYTPEKEKTKEIFFDQSRNIAEREGVKYEIPNGVYDPISVFFGFLNQDFKLNEEIVLNLLSKEEIYEFKIIPIELKNGIYKLKGDVHRSDKSSFHGADFTIWVLNDKKRIPLLIKVVSAAGPVYVRLIDIK